MTEALYSRTTRWLTDNVTHILPGLGKLYRRLHSEKARQLVRRRGVRILVVDPLNRIDQQLEPDKRNCNTSPAAEQAEPLRPAAQVPRYSRGASAQGEPQHHQRRTAAGWR